jgi:hypothetical protein
VPRPIPPATALALVALLAACTPARPTPTPSPAPTVAVQSLPTPTADGAPRTELPVGVQVFEAEVATDALEQLRGAGVAWARTRALWKLVEPERRTPARYDWTVTDWLFGDTASAGFRNVASVYANPPWAAATECGPVAADQMDRYAALWTALVERYDGDGVDDATGSPVVRYWQVSNEADFDPTVASDETDYGGCFGNEPDAYAEQLVVAYRAAHKADPDVRIGFGPVACDRFTAASAPAGWSAPPGPFVYDFTQRALAHLYTAHAGDPDLPFLDFVSLHSYNDNGHYWDGPSRPLETELVGKVARFRAEQLAQPGVFDVRAAPIMITETGLASGPSDAYTERSEALQAMYVGQTMVRAQAAGVLAAIWYTARDNIMGDCLPPHWDWLAFGLMRSREYLEALDGRCPLHPWVESYPLDHGPATPKPAMVALATLTQALAGYTFERQLAPADTGDAAIEAYSFVRPDGRRLLAAWTTTGERLGKVGVDPVAATLTASARTLAPWTGTVIATDHLGTWRDFGGPGSPSVDVPLTEAPTYLTTDAAGAP